MPLKLFDFFIAVPALGVVIASFFIAYTGAGGPSLVFLKSENNEWVFPIDADETVTAPGPLGETVIEISGGAARITASPCVNRICVAAGKISSPGRWAACLPNRVLLFISPSSETGKTDSDVDAAAW